MCHAINELKKGYGLNIIIYFRGCSFLKIACPRHTFLLDIRTGSVSNKKINRLAYDLLMTVEASFFKHISIISKSLAQKLGLGQKAYILSLGADVISACEKTFDSMNLLYVGTLYNRNIDQTIKGFSKFYHEYKNKIPTCYTIVGKGLTTEEEQLRALVKRYGIGSSVKIAGQIPHDRLKPFFDTHNIGVSYIPKTDYFEVQPPTKTYEYLLSGMPVIATETLENANIIDDKNGILINDTSEDFYQGLVKIYRHKKKYHSKEIRFNSLKYTWSEIVGDLNAKIASLMN